MTDKPTALSLVFQCEPAQKTFLNKDLPTCIICPGHIAYTQQLMLQNFKKSHKINNLTKHKQG